MEAEFRHPQRGNALGMLFCALLSAVCAACAWDGEGEREVLIVLAMIFLAGAGAFAISACLMRGMRLRVSDACVEGQTNLHRRFSLPAEQLAYVNEFGDTVILLDADGRRYVFPKMENALLMREEILARLARDEPSEETAARLREVLPALRCSRLRKILLVAAAALCMFGSIAVGAIGTGDRDFPDMTERDWRITACVAVMFALSLAAMLVLASWAGKDSLQIQRAEWRLRGVIAFLAPLPVENVIAAYVNRSHSERTVFYQAEDGVHMHFDRILGDGKLRDEGEYSEAMASREALLEEMGYESVDSFEKDMIRIR